MAEISKTVDQALRLLAELGAGGSGSAAELARRTGLNRTVVHRLLATLQRHQAVRRRDGSFELGLGLVALGRAVEVGVREAAGPALEHLVAQLDETAVLALPDDGTAVAVDQVVCSRQPLQVRYQPGYRHPLTRGAHGRAILAFAGDDALAAVLDRLGDDPALRRRLARVRERGYETSHDELQLGTSGVAAPVRDYRGRVVASIGVVAPTQRLADESRVVACTLDAAAAVSDRLQAGTATAGPRAGAA